MTTIAYRDGYMASDTLLCEGDLVCCEKIRKVRRVGPWVVGYAGMSSYAESVLAAIEAKLQEEPVEWSDDLPSVAAQIQPLPEKQVEDLEDAIALQLLLVHGQTRRIYFADLTVDGLVLTTQVEDEYAAIGNGGAVALTAMDLGCTAADAVRCAMRRTKGTGGQVRITPLDLGAVEELEHRYTVHQGPQVQY